MPAKHVEAVLAGRLSNDDLAYHRQVVAQINRALAARDSWAGHLTAKYQLGPGDTVEDDGVIVRNGSGPDGNGA